MLFLSVWLALAAAGEPLTLTEAARLAADGAPAARRAADEAEAALARRDAAHAHFFPSLGVEAGVLSSDDPVDAFALALKQERFSATSFFASDPNHPARTTDWNGSVSLAWSVGLFGSTRSHERAAESGAASAGYVAQRTRDGVGIQAIEALVRARTAEDSLTILGERRSDAERDVAIASALFEQGMTTQADPARARAALADVRAQEAAAQSVLAEARAALSALIGPEAASRSLAPLSDPGPAGNEKNAESAKRDDVLAAELSAQAAGQTASAARAARYPAAFVQGQYQAHAPRPGEHWGDSSSIFGGLRVPLFTSGAVRSGILEASALAHAAQETAEETRRRALKEVASARAAVVSADAREEAYLTARAAAGEAAGIQHARYEEGVGRLSDLLEARGAELSARLAATAARGQRILARAQLRFAMGLDPGGEEKK
jgi:outer membrane protein TolC